jgi:hypothetical protein
MTKNWICFGFLLPFLIAPIAEGLAQSPGRLKRSKCIPRLVLPRFVLHPGRRRAIHRIHIHR